MITARDVVVFCVGVLVPFALLAIAVAVEPLLQWVEDADDRAARRWAQTARPAVEPATDEIPAVTVATDEVDDAPSTVRLFDAWDASFRDLTGRPDSGRHRA